MSTPKKSMIDYKELLDGLQHLRSHKNLADFAPLLFLFVIWLVWSVLFVQFVDMGGGGKIHIGTSFDKPIATEKLEFYRQLAQSNGTIARDTVSQTDLAAALNAANPQYVPDFLNFTYETNPSMGWVFLLFVLLGYVIPGGYALYSFLQGEVPPRVRQLLQGLVIVAGLFWIATMYANGVTVKNPAQSINSVVFWMMYGALCLHLFFDVGSKAGRYFPYIFAAVWLFVLLAANHFSFSEVFNTPISFEAETEQLNSVALTGWWVHLKGFIIINNSATFWLWVILLLGTKTLYDVYESRLVKSIPYLNLAFVTLFITTTIFLVLASIGMGIKTPAQALARQTLFFYFGLLFLNYTRGLTQMNEATKSLIKTQMEKIEKKTGKADKA